jgi:hypothetical protein
MPNLEQLELNDLSKMLGLLYTTHKAYRLLAYSKILDNSLVVTIPPDDLFPEQNDGHFSLQLAFPTVNDNDVLTVRLSVSYRVEQEQNVGILAPGKWCNLLSAPIVLEDLLDFNFFKEEEKANVVSFALQNIDRPKTLRLVSYSNVVLKLRCKSIPVANGQLKVKSEQSFTLAIAEISAVDCQVAARQLS